MTDFLTQGQQAIVFIVGTFNRLSTDELNLPLKLLKDGAVAPSSGGITVGPELFIHITGNKMSMYENIKDKFGKRNTAVEIERLKRAASDWRGGEQLLLFSYSIPSKS